MFCTPNSEGSFHRPLPIKKRKKYESNIFAKITNSSELVDTDFSMSSRKLSSNRRSGKRRTERPTEEIRFIRSRRNRSSLVFASLLELRSTDGNLQFPGWRLHLLSPGSRDSNGNSGGKAANKRLQYSFSNPRGPIPGKILSLSGRTSRQRLFNYTRLKYHSRVFYSAAATTRNSPRQKQEGSRGLHFARARSLYTYRRLPLFPVV